jgi:hypothetical protein
MKIKNNVRIFFRKYFYKIRAFNIMLGALIIFYGAYFSDKEFTIETIIQDRKNIKMYLCILIAFGTSFLINYVIGGFKKKNVEKMIQNKKNQK